MVGGSARWSGVCGLLCHGEDLCDEFVDALVDLCWA